MKNSVKKKQGIEVSRWKVGDAEDFQGLDTRIDTDIEPPIDFDPSPELLQMFNEWYVKRGGETLSEDEGKEAIRNVVRFIEVLHECDIRNKKKGQNP